MNLTSLRASLVSALPLLAGLIGPFVFVSEIPADLIKTAFLQAALALVFAVSASGREKISRKLESSESKWLVILAASVFIWSCASLFWSVNSWEALLVLDLQFTCLLAAVISFAFFSGDDLEKTASTVALSGALVSLIGLIQVFSGFDLYFQAASPASTFGNRNNAGEFVVITLPFLLRRSAQPGGGKWYAALTICLLYLFAGGSRACWIASALILTVHGSIFFAGNAASGRKKQRNQFAAAVAAAAFLILILPGDKQVKKISSLTSQVSLEEKKANERVAMNANTLLLLKDHWLIGTGAGNWRIQYPKYSSRTWKDKAQGDGALHIHAHNDVLEMTASLGFPFLVAFLAGLWFFFRLFLRHWHRDNLGLAVATGLAALAALVNSLFSFPFKLLPVPLILSLFAPVFLSGDSLKLKPAAVSGKLRIILPLTAAVFLIFTFWKEFTQLRARYHYSTALILQQSGNYSDSMREIRTAIQILPADDYMLISSAQNLIHLERFEEAGRELDRVLATRPNHPGALHDRALVYYRTGKQGEALAFVRKLLHYIPDHAGAVKLLVQPDFFPDEETRRKEYLSLLAQDQRHHAIREQLARLQVKSGLFEQAAANFRILAKERGLGEDHLNLGVVLYENLGRREEGAQSFRRALELNPKLPQADAIRSLPESGQTRGSN